MHARLIRCALAGLVLTVTGATSIAGCLDRPVVAGEPATKTNFTTQVAEQAVDKLDILFSIDNSASMGDKQAYLSAAIPDLISRLITPNCVSPTGAIDGPSTLGSDGTANCTAYQTADPGSQTEFPAVHDMHIGIVSSSLGPRLGDQDPADGSGGECLPTATISFNGTTIYNHNDDQGHLITRSSDPTLPVTAAPTEVPLADNAVGSPTCSPDQCPTGSTSCTPACSTPGNPGSGFLAWFPPALANGGPSGDAGSGVHAETVGTQLQTDFADLIAGVHEYGCGIESQLESWYRFLIQPDPYASLALNANGGATWVGVDTTIIQERHDFLRPDSLVAVIVLSDENDSEIDVRSIGGQGYLWMSTKFYPPMGTQACATNPGASGCTSCQLICGAGQTDPACTCSGKTTSSNYTAPTDWGYDLNLRHVHMQSKYGLDPQFPITRYTNGLTSPVVPDRLGEYPVNSSGAQSSNYVGNNDCTNPLFAATLPTAAQLSATVATTETSSDATTLCNKSSSGGANTGPRTKSLVFYAIIGGVPWQLLHFDPNSETNSALQPADWVRILGQGPVASPPNYYDYTGIDPHMVESYQPRTGSTAPSYQTASLLPAYPLPNLCTQGGSTCGTSPAETAPQAPGSGSTADPYNGSEWITNVGPHLDLNVDREYACIFPLTNPRDCSKDAAGNYNVPANGDACDCSSTGLSATQLSPLCSQTTPTTQNYAKAYPTIRELTVANQLGTNGIVSSICPIDVQDNTAKDDPLYGYRPAVASIINRLKNALTNQCLPQKLTASDAGGGVPCLILATLPNTTPGNASNPEADCAKYPGMSIPDSQILAQFESSAVQTWQQAGSNGQSPQSLPTCQVAQLTGSQLDSTGSCKAVNASGWCYVTGSAAGTCDQAILFSPGTLPTGSTVNLQCIETSSALAAGQEGDGG